MIKKSDSTKLKEAVKKRNMSDAAIKARNKKIATAKAAKATKRKKYNAVGTAVSKSIKGSFDPMSILKK